MEIIDYISFAFLLFFITFFVDIFVQYFRTKTVIPRKMFTYKKGGVFEHYIIVSIIMLAILIIGLITQTNPFVDETIFAQILFIVPIMIVAFIFLVFLFVFVFYFMTAFYIKLTKVEEKTEFYQKHTHKMITTAFIISFLIIILAVISGLTQLI